MVAQFSSLKMRNIANNLVGKTKLVQCRPDYGQMVSKDIMFGKPHSMHNKIYRYPPKTKVVIERSAVCVKIYGELYRKKEEL